jgi:hypothetical protein
MHATICLAIRERRLLEFDYHGHHRVVAAYCHGQSARGEEIVRAVQLRRPGSTSASGGFGFGKLWRVGEMRALSASDERFVPDDPDYHPDDRAIPTIHCRI